MTASELIKSSLRKIGAMSAADTMNAAEEATNLSALNLMLASWATKNWIDAFTALAIGDTVPLDDDELRAAAHNFAIEIAPEYSRSVSQEVAKIAEESLKIIRDARLTSFITTTDIAVSGAYNYHPDILTG